MSEDTLRVALVARGSHVAGGEVSLLTLAGELDDPLVWTTERGELESRARAAGLRVHAGRWEAPDRGNPRRFFALVREILRALDAHGVDLVHVNSPVEAAAFVMAARFSHRPCVVHVRIRYEASFLRRQALTWADAVVFNSLALRSEVGWPKGVVIPNGVELPSAVVADRSRLRVALGAAAGDLLLAQVGQVIAVKGVDVSLRATARLRAQGWPVRLVVIGDDNQTAGRYREEMERLAMDLGIADRVAFLGYRRDASELAAGFDVLLCPSRVEPFGRVLIESMAHGVPVVASRVGGIPEVVRHGIDGWLVGSDDADALAERTASLLADPGVRARMGESARARVRSTFSGAAHATAVRALYDRVRAPYLEGRGR